MKDVLPLIMRGKHEAGQLDADFIKDENKKATATETRKSELDNAYKLAMRLMHNNINISRLVIAIAFNNFKYI